MYILRTPVFIVTATGFALAGCAASTTSLQQTQPADLPAAYQPEGGGVRLASLGGMVTDASNPMSGGAEAGSGQVLLTLSEEAEPQETQEAQATLEQRMQQVAQQAAQQVAVASEKTTQQAVQQAVDKVSANLAQERALTVAQAQQAAQQAAQQVVEKAPVTITEQRMRQLAQQSAQQAVEEAQPQIKAVALQTMNDSREYIRGVARGAVREGDADMTKALSEAARSAIASDDKVVFAIRKAVADQLTTAQQAADGPAGKSSALVLKSEEMALNTANLNIGKLQAPAGEAGTSAGVAQNTLAELAPEMLGKGGPAGYGSSHAPKLDIRKYHVVAHEDGRTLQQLLSDVVNSAKPFTGPWTIKWKISEENKDILNEKFSLDVETSFDNFVSYLAQYMVNDRGIKISFSLFDSERIIVVSD